MPLMSDPTISNQDVFSSSHVPQFGLLDVVEAFTAMRHEWRTQSRENRELAESMQASTKLLERIASTIDQKLSSTSGDGLPKMISLVIELDTSLQRAVNAMVEYKNLTSQHGLVESLNTRFQQSGFFNRWLGQKFFREVIETVETATNQPDPMMEGIQLVLNRLHRMMAEEDLTRVDPTGEAFDAETMKAIATVSSGQVPAGYVAGTITPGYFYRRQLIRFAEVRVAR